MTAVIEIGKHLHDVLQVAAYGLLLIGAGYLFHGPRGKE